MGSGLVPFSHHSLTSLPLYFFQFRMSLRHSQGREEVCHPHDRACLGVLAGKLELDHQHSREHAKKNALDASTERSEDAEFCLRSAAPFPPVADDLRESKRPAC